MIRQGTETRFLERKSSYSYDDIIAHTNGELFGPEFARLPAPPMLMFDRITSITADGGTYGKGEVVAEFDIKPDLWFFECHFKSDPVMPGCLGLDALWQLLGFYLGWAGNPGKGRALGVGNVKFTDQVLTSSKLVTYKVNVKRVMARQITLGIGDGQMLVDGNPAYEIQDMRVTVVPEGIEG